jgi:hypothetical protein
VRKKSKYKPKPVMLDNMQFVKSGMMPVTTAVDVVLSFSIANHDALSAISNGTGTPDNVKTLSHAFITSQSLADLGTGNDWMEELDAAQQALLQIATRFQKWSKVQCTPAELEALNLGMEIHDAQVEGCTVAQLEKAVKRAKNAIRCNTPTRRDKAKQTILRAEQSVANKS